MALGQKTARQIVMKLGESGTPPERGVSHFTVGLESILRALDEEYLDTEKGAIGNLQLSAFKLVVGSYGGGKTHLLFNIRDLAWSRGYVTSYVQLSPSECPFDRLDLVYKTIASNLMYPLPEDETFSFGDLGIEAFFMALYEQKKSEFAAESDGDELSQKLREYARTITGTESTSMWRAAQAAFSSRIDGDEDSFQAAIQWLKHEGYEKAIHAPLHITEKIDKSSAFRMIRSLAQLVNALGFTGLILLFDEAERAVSLQSSKSRNTALDNLRQMVDECGNSRLPACMIFYAIPNANDLLGGAAPVYEALKGRLSKVFRLTNPVAPQIDLESLDIAPVDLLHQIGLKLASIYDTAYQINLDRAAVESNAETVATQAFEMRYADIGYRRIFVKSFIELLQQMRLEHSLRIDAEQARELLTTGLADLRQKEVAAVDEHAF